MPFEHFGIEEIDQIRSDRFRRLHDYWNMTRGSRPRPTWSEIDLMAVYDIAANVYVKDIIADGTNFHYRYWGTQLTETFGYDMSGKTARDHYSGEMLTMTIDNHVAMLQAGVPLISKGKTLWATDLKYRDYTALVLPLDGEQGPLQHLLAGFEFPK